MYSIPMKKQTYVKSRYGLAAALVAALAFLVVSCEQGESIDPPTVGAQTWMYSAENPVVRVNTGFDFMNVTIDGLSGQDVILVKENVSPYWTASTTTGTITGLSTASVRSVLPARAAGPSMPVTLPTGNVRQDYAPARDFDGAAVLRRAASLARSATYSGTIPGIIETPATGTTGTAGETHSFWVQDSSDAWVQTGATLRATGDHCFVWVADTNYNTTSTSSTDNLIGLTEAQALADKFDAIYVPETSLLGFEYGAGVDTAASNYGGTDGEIKVNILVYDIDGDFAETQTGGTYGFFWAKDLFTQTALDSAAAAENKIAAKTNAAEIFYIDAHFTDSDPAGIYSTLIHEFQHMINFNRKTIQTGGTQGSDSWYTEMLSMMAEDVLDPIIAIYSTDEGHPVMSRIPLFNAYYDFSGLTNWIEGDNVVVSYSNAYAFGAYLARNYGGADLLKAMMDNSTVNIQSVTDALVLVNGSGSSFNEAFRRYGEALVFNDSGSALKSFNKTVTAAIPGTDSVSRNYTFDAFDICGMQNLLAGDTTYQIPLTWTGPSIWGLYTGALGPYGLSLQTASNLSNMTGTVTLTVAVPTDPDVELYLMVVDYAKM